MSTKLLNNEPELVFDDVLINVKFSRVGSRKNCNLKTIIPPSHKDGKALELNLPVISSNMESITGAKMAAKMNEVGGLGILHRFCSIEDNVKMFLEATNNEPEGKNVGCSIGISEDEFVRAASLYKVGCRIFCIDVAHGAQEAVVDQAIALRAYYGNSIFLIVGNFSNSTSIHEFNLEFTKCCNNIYALPEMYKIFIGSGSICATRLKTGAGRPTLSTILDCARYYNVIADGGFKTPGDICKALAAGASLIMTGSMLSGTDEANGTIISGGNVVTGYWGSASGGYASGFKTSEGVVAENVKYKGAVENILKDIEGGLRSSMTYTNSATLEEFRENTQFIRVSSNTTSENKTVND